MVGVRVEWRIGCLRRIVRGLLGLCLLGVVRCRRLDTRLPHGLDAGVLVEGVGASLMNQGLEEVEPGCRAL